MKKLILAVIIVCLAVSAPVSYATSTQDHTCQGGHNCNDDSGGGNNSNNNTNTNNNTAKGGSATSNLTSNITNNLTNTLSNKQSQSQSSNSSSSNTNSVSSSSNASNGGVSVEGDDVRSLSQYFQGAEGKDEMQLGSAIFGGLSVSNDSDSNNIRQNLGVLIATHKAGLLNDNDAKYVAHVLVAEMKETGKADRCLGIKQSRKRTLFNGFKLIC